jgi:hypothetical protein
MATLLPASRLGIFARNQSMRVLPILARLGRRFGGRIERASRAVTLPPDSSQLSPTNQTGATSGLPSDAVYPSIPARVRSEMKAITSSVSWSTRLAVERSAD